MERTTCKAWLHRHRRAILNTVTAIGVAALLALNILFPYLIQKKGSYIDLTPEELYTLSDEMIDTCSRLKGDITVTFCADPDQLLENYEARYVYIMAVQLAARFDNIHVETYNISENPTAVNRFKTTSATQILPTHVIVSCGNRYRILSVTSFWMLGESSESSTDYYSFNGEYKMATAFLSITSVEEPVVCFAYGHGEHIYVSPTDSDAASLLASSDDDRSELYALMQNAGLKVKYLNLDEEEIPDDCVLLIMDGPTEDYSVGNPNSLTERTALRRIHEFLSEKNGAFMLFKDPTASLKNLEDLMDDWGIGYDDEHYIREDAAHSLSDPDNTRQKLIVTLSTDDTTIPYSVYSDIVSLGISPRTIAEDSGAVYGSWINDYVGSSGMENVGAYYFDFFTTSDGAYAYTLDGKLDAAEAQSYALAGLTLRMKTDSDTGDTYYSYVFGAATTALTSNTYLANSAYCNYDILYATVRYISRVDEYASISLGGSSLNSPKLGGKPLQTVKITEGGNTIYNDAGLSDGYYTALTDTDKIVWTLVLLLVPAVAGAVAGTVILVKRKNR
jgi:hypothetical protein